jgi:hypothetical protein
MQTQTITVPSNLNDIPLIRMQEYEQLPKDMDEFEKTIQAVSIFCNISIKEVKAMPMDALNKVVSILMKALNDKPKFEATFELNGIKYGFVPNMDELTTGEFIDIENYNNKGDMYKTLSVLYRPINVEGQGGRYDIEPYNGKINEEFKMIPSGIAYGSMVFFWTIGIDLLNCILKFLETNPKVQIQNTIFNKSGDGLALSTGYVREILHELTQLQNTPFTKPSFGPVTKVIWRKSKNKPSINHLKPTDEQ